MCYLTGNKHFFTFVILYGKNYVKVLTISQKSDVGKYDRINSS
jgi:hypothetical protein